MVGCFGGGSAVGLSGHPFRAFADDSEANNTVTRLDLDLAHRHGIRVMVDVVADFGSPGFINRTHDRIASLRDHPAVLGWYASDELGMDYLALLQTLHGAVVAADADHPSWSVFSTQVAHIEDFIDTFDVVGTDPYPIGQGVGLNASLVRDWTAYTVDGVANARPVHHLPLNSHHVHCSTIYEYCVVISISVVASNTRWYF